MTYTREVMCEVPECESPATHKVAATWSYGSFSELKCYGLACDAHAGAVFQDAKERSKYYPHSCEEREGEIGIYGYEPGKGDKRLERLDILEILYS